MGKHVLSENEILEIAVEVWEKQQSSKIASAYMTGKIETGQTRIYNPKVETQV